MAPQPSAADPHSAYHAYDFYDLVAKSTSPKYTTADSNGVKLAPTLSCVPIGAPTTCTLKPRVRLTDNWGWCTEGSTGFPCPPSGKCSNGKTCNSDKDCVIGNCYDGWWELGEVITVNEP
jgi:hypothetical protein